MGIPFSRPSLRRRKFVSDHETLKKTKGGPAKPPFSRSLVCGCCPQTVRLFLEVTIVKTLETFAVTRFVLAHFMYRIVNRIQVQLLGQRSDTLLVLASAALGLHTGLTLVFVSQTISPSSSANLAACSASSHA